MKEKNNSIKQIASLILAAAFMQIRLQQILWSNMTLYEFGLFMD